MHAFLACSLALCFWLCSAQGHQDQANKIKKGSSDDNPILRLDSLDFLKMFDKEERGYVTKEQMPPRLAPFFDRADRNGDGKLDRSEIEQMLQAVRARAKTELKKSPNSTSDDIPPQVRQILERMDTNKDGKLSKAEAKGRILENFDRIDRNKDGYVDMKELTQFVRQAGLPGPMAGKMGNGFGPAPTPAFDFDALDANADGRLSKEELKKTPWADKFEEIDIDKDGKISKKEWEAFLKKRPS